MSDAPGCMSTDEYQLADSLREAVEGDKNAPHKLGIVEGVNMATDFAALFFRNSGGRKILHRFVFVILIFVKTG